MSDDCNGDYGVTSFTEEQCLISLQHPHGWSRAKRLVKSKDTPPLLQQTHTFSHRLHVCVQFHSFLGILHAARPHDERGVVTGILVLEVGQVL